MQICLQEGMNQWLYILKEMLDDLNNIRPGVFTDIGTTEDV